MAQLYTGSVTGTVTDPSGAVVPNAKATLVDVSRGLTYTAGTDAVGRFVIRNLPPTINTFHQVQFCGHNQALNSGSFGQVTSQCNSPRQVQLGAKLYS